MSDNATAQQDEKKVAVQAWFMSVRNDQHDKQYVCFISETHIAVIQWGRYGASGTTNAAKYPTAEHAKTAAMKQVYAKISKGYKYEIDGIKFMTSQRALDQALNLANSDLLMSELKEAHRTGAFQSQAEAVLQHYEDFSSQASQLLEEAATGSAVDILQRFEGLEQAWATISKQHAETQATLNITKRMLAQALSGATVGS